jgi:hypothetical protein
VTPTPASTHLDAPTLDWEAFCAARFPHVRRQDLDAIVAYGAYTRSQVEERSSEGAARVDDENRRVRSTALQSWEDEGGAARWFA